MDPLTRHAAALAPFPSFAERPAEAPVEARAAASLEDLLPQLVRRVAWGGDRRAGTVRLELGAGALAGATLLIHAEDGRVRVELRAPAGTDAAGWRDRIHDRLTARGLLVDGVTIS